MHFRYTKGSETLPLLSVNRTLCVCPTVAYSGTLSSVRPSSLSCIQIDVSLNYKNINTSFKSKIKPHF